MRAVLALALLIGYFVLGVGLTVGLVAVAVRAWTVQDDPGGAVWLVLIAAGIGVPMAVSGFRALRVRPEPGGVALTRDAQPELWRHVDELAAIAETRSPDDIWLVPEANAGVWERHGRRHLELGLPLVAGMTVSELRSVLAHELGHYGGGHTKLSAATFRAKLALEGSLQGLGAGGFGAIVYAYARIYALVAASVSRDHETYADERSVAAAGRSSAQRALLLSGPLHHAWTDFLASYVSLANDAKRTPPLLAGFRSYLDHPRRVHELRELERTFADDEPSSVFDSHPPVRQRVAAMEAMSGPAVVTDDRPAWTVVVALDHLAQELLEPLPLADWQEIATVAGPAQIGRYAEVLAHAGRVSGIGSGLGELLTGLERGELRKLTGDPADHSLPPEEVQRAAVETVTELLACAVASALVRSQRATLELNWGGMFSLRMPDGALVFPDDLVAPAVRDPLQVPDLRARLRAMGVDGL